jgi:AcrR family transcriptional regulator
MQLGQKSTQRERLIAGIIGVANRQGYAGASVSAVAAEAKVSKPTFYVYFKDRDDCFACALVDVQELLRERVRAALAEDPEQDAVVLAIATIVAFAATQPQLARFLMAESLAAGASALDARDRGIAELAGAIDEALDSRPPSTPSADLPFEAVIGGVYRLLASRLRRGEPATAALSREIREWIGRYATPRDTHRWREISQSPAIERSPYLPATELRAPEPLPLGRPRLSEAEVAENQRQRIMFAAAQLAGEKGYAATTVTEIAKRARVDLRAFYALFAEKQEIFTAVHELGFQEVMAVTSFAFFAGASWPQRSWEAGRAFTQFLETHPTIARIGFVDAYAVGPAAAQRIEDSQVAFTIFLQEGLQQLSTSAPPSRAALEAIVTTIFEIVYREVRAGRIEEISAVLPSTTHLWLTPFLGPAQATAFIDAATGSPQRRRRKALNT